MSWIFAGIRQDVAGYKRFVTIQLVSLELIAIAIDG